MKFVTDDLGKPDDKRERIASYEKLIEEPVQALGDLCDCPGEEYSDFMLDRCLSNWI